MNEIYCHGQNNELVHCNEVSKLMIGNCSSYVDMDARIGKDSDGIQFPWCVSEEFVDFSEPFHRVHFLILLIHALQSDCVTRFHHFRRYLHLRHVCTQTFNERQRSEIKTMR